MARALLALSKYSELNVPTQTDTHRVYHDSTVTHKKSSPCFVHEESPRIRHAERKLSSGSDLNVVRLFADIC